jgi:hypothetical protein
VRRRVAQTAGKQQVVRQQEVVAPHHAHATQLRFADPQRAKHGENAAVENVEAWMNMHAWRVHNFQR